MAYNKFSSFFLSDVEELSARLSLMAAASAAAASEEKGGEIRLKAAEIGSSNDANYLNSRCVYLEQLLSGKCSGLIYEPYVLAKL